MGASTFNPYRAPLASHSDVAKHLRRWSGAAAMTCLFAFGATSFVTVIGLTILRQARDADLFLWMALLAIPAGPIVTGFLCSSGWWSGMRWWRVRPTRRIAAFVAIVTMLIEPILLYVRYVFGVGFRPGTSFVYGDPSLDRPDFLTYTRYDVSHHVYQSAQGGLSDIGDWWSLVIAAQVVGLAAGSLAGLAIARRSMASFTDAPG